jgi:D-beta-D-heptose 7-phosphate kinase/D-beta-D-heptose 1-phosphate adenosyltransferase
MKRVVVIGDCMIDETWYGVAEKLSPEAPIPVIQLKEIIQTPGGALNVIFLRLEAKK